MLIVITCFACLILMACLYSSIVPDIMSSTSVKKSYLKVVGFILSGIVVCAAIPVWAALTILISMLFFVKGINKPVVEEDGVDNVLSLVGLVIFSLGIILIVGYDCVRQQFKKETEYG